MIHTVESMRATGKVTREGECLVWNGALAGKGYGVIADDRERYAHRLALLLDDRPAGEQQARHRCGNTRCIEPSHLLSGTQAQNEADKALIGRNNRGIPGVTHCGRYLNSHERCKREPHEGPCKPDIFAKTYEVLS